MTGARMAAIVLALVAVLAGSGCGGGGGGAPSTLRVDDAWARSTPATASTAAVYLTIENGTATDDALAGADVAPALARGLMLHRTMTTSSGEEMDMSSMTETSSIDVPAGSAATLEPGGDHLMLMGVRKELVVGTAFELTLHFRSGTELTTSVEVRDE